MQNKGVSISAPVKYDTSSTGGRNLSLSSYSGHQYTNLLVHYKTHRRTIEQTNDEGEGAVV